MSQKFNIISQESPSNYKTSFGVQTMASAADTVKTGLKKVLHVTASLASDPAASSGTGNTVTAQIAANGSDIILKTWTAASVANTVFGGKVFWKAVGY